MPDVRFISDLIDTLEAKYNIDPQEDSTRNCRACSNGGSMAFVLSCTLSDRIAAIGAVAAAQSLPWSWCTDTRPVPMIAFHGTADPIMPYNGGSAWRAPIAFPGARGWTANWARRNHCSTDPLESRVAVDVMRLAYTGCADSADVVLYTIEGGGHTWPGGKPPPAWLAGATNRSIDASRVMWEFFREHPLSKH